ncbi:copper-binding protein [Stutzerimonas urumqiensis]|uniref:copper-binding protein n=1 Tax=Stutzerimonas urumqiensis TaxID=638269 RepID=UPI003BAD323E
MKAATAQATGTVRKIDHDRPPRARPRPGPSLGWPAMVMPFKASAEQRAAVAVGDTVAFEFDPQGMATLTHIGKR